MRDYYITFKDGSLWIMRHCINIENALRKVKQVFPDLEIDTIDRLISID